MTHLSCKIAKRKVGRGSLGNWLTAFIAICGLISGARVGHADAKSQEEIVGYLKAGKISDGQSALKTRIEQSPQDDEARVGLGVLQFVHGVEHLAQSLYRYGSKIDDGVGSRLPFFRLPVPANEHPEVVRYADIRRMLQNVIDDMSIAEKTLTQVKDKSIKLNLPLTRIRLDINGNGMAENDELLVTLVAAVALPGRASRELLQQEMIVGFDYADVLWLRGYCHLLSAMANAVLMYDEQSTFDLMARYAFSKPELPASEFRLQTSRIGWDVDPWVDVVAAVHKAVYPVKEPQRGPKVLEHLQQVIALSRLTWAEILSETDNDHEWIPNPKQTSIVPGITISQEMINTWHLFLSEGERLLNGELLIPHWRFPVEAGVNLKRFFTEPRDFDVVMLIHGQAALPYAERGRCTSQETWNQFQQMFGGRFIGFAMWFN